MNKQTSHEKAFDYAKRLFKYSPRSARELNARLRQKGYSYLISHKIVNEFCAQGVVNDRVLGEYLISKKMHRCPISFRFMETYLRAKGLSAELIKELIDKFKPIYPEKETITALAKKKISCLNKYSEKETKKRIFNYLMMKGFSPADCMDAVNKAYEQV